MAAQDSTHPLTRAQWRAWLVRHHLRTQGVWVLSYKKATGKPVPGYDDIVEEALCFGSIDSKPNKLDDARSKLWLAPRKPRTGGSRLNKARVQRMIAASCMAPAGLAKVEATQRDGSWAALDAVKAAELPDDLLAAFERRPGSRANFEAFPRSAKRGILEWIANAKRAPTRARRLEDTATLATRKERANQWPAPAGRASRDAEPS